MLGDETYDPSEDWALAGPIIERERITLETRWNHEGSDSVFIAEWSAFVGHDAQHDIDGPTPIIAAMRAYVASKFGAEVELP